MRKILLCIMKKPGLWAAGFSGTLDEAGLLGSRIGEGLAAPQVGKVILIGRNTSLVSGIRSQQGFLGCRILLEAEVS